MAEGIADGAVHMGQENTDGVSGLLLIPYKRLQQPVNVADVHRSPDNGRHMPVKD